MARSAAHKSAPQDPLAHVREGVPSGQQVDLEEAIAAALPVTAAAVLPALMAPEPAPAAIGHNSGEAEAEQEPDAEAAQELASAIERIKKLDSDIAAINADKAAVFKHLRGRGYDVDAVRRVVKADRIDPLVREQKERRFGVYWRAYQGAKGRAE